MINKKKHDITKRVLIFLVLIDLNKDDVSTVKFISREDNMSLD